MTMADTIAVMNHGKIERLGPPVEIYEDPRTAFVAGFLGACNLMSGTVNGSQVALQDGTSVHLSNGAANGKTGAVKLGVRPEKVSLFDPSAEGTPPNRLPGKVTDASFVGVSTHYLIDTPCIGEMAVVIQNLNDHRFAPGEEVVAAWRPEHTFVVA